MDTLADLFRSIVTDLHALEHQEDELAICESFLALEKRGWAPSEALLKRVAAARAALRDEAARWTRKTPRRRDEVIDRESAADLTDIELSGMLVQELDPCEVILSADAPPRPNEWLTLSEDERILMCEQAHLDCPREETGPWWRVHMARHAIVETQLARGNERLVAALAWLRKAGLGRHDATHVLWGCIERELIDALGDDRAFNEARVAPWITVPGTRSGSLDLPRGSRSDPPSSRAPFR